MTDPALAQKLRAVLLCATGLLFAILLGVNIGNDNFAPLLVVGGIAALAFLTFSTGSFFWVLTVASSFLAGTLPILRGSFTPFQILMVIGVGKFLVEDIVLRRTQLKLGNRLDLLLICGFMGVLTLHAVHDRFGMKFLGSTIWGGRNYINVFVGLAAFFIVQSVRINSKAWAKLPYVILAVTGFDLIITVITTVFPASIYKIYPFYSAVSVAGVTELVTGSAVETARVGGYGNFGFILIILVLAAVSLRKLLAPWNFFRFFTFACGWCLVLFSSYRSTVINTLIATISAGIRDLKQAVLLLLPILAVFLLGLSVVNSEFFRLPKQVQRSLAFLPGKWDAQMEFDAEASNDFRKKIWTVFVQEYFPLHPWLGRGFGFRSQAAEESAYKDNPNWDRETVEVGNVHNGFFGALDALGVIGTFFFVVWNFRLLIRTFSVPSPREAPFSIALRFLALYLAVSIMSYWVGALNVGVFLPQEFAMAGVFLRLQSEMARIRGLSRPAEKLSDRKLPEFAAAQS